MKSIILRPPFFLSFTKVDFFIFGILYFYIKSKISLLISSAKVAGVLNTLQTKVNFEIAIVFAIQIRPCIDISFADQMFRIFLKESSRSKKFFWLQVAHHKRSRHLEHRRVLHLISSFELCLVDGVKILVTTTILTLTGLFLTQKSFRTGPAT